MNSVRSPYLRPWGAWMVAAVLSLPASVCLAAADANNPAAYSLRMPLATATDAPLQRLVLPAEALVRLQSPGYADVRVFNGAGQPVPMALAGVVAPPGAPEEPPVVLPAYPILGPGGTAGTASTGGGLDGLSLRIEERQGQRVVQIDAAGAAPAGGAQAVRGALLDARSVQRPVARMALDADLPAGQPVTFTVQVSRDLRAWRPLAETVLYRAEAAAAPAAPGRLGAEQIDLSGADLKDHYLRITWGDAAVTLRGATLALARGAGPRERVSARVAVPPLGSHPRELVFALPFATPVAALQITPQGRNVLHPVRVLGRNHREQPWSPLASAVVYQMSSAGGREQRSGPIELGGASVRELKLEADAKTPGFAAAPEVALLFEPVQLVFLASGPGPFTLAAGLPGAAAAAAPFLPLASLVPGYQSGQENTLPLAQAEAARADATAGAATQAPLVPAAPVGEGLSTRTAVLWGVLLAGVAALALLAWLLVRQVKPAHKASGAPEAPSDAA